MYVEDSTPPTGLAITSKGRTAAELMVFARYVMFSEVYWHHAVRSATAMLTRAFLELHRSLPLDDLLTMGDADLVRAMQQAAGDGPVAKLVDGSVGSGRQLYKRAFEFSREEHETLYDRLTHQSAEQLAALGNRLGESVGLPAAGSVLLDVPSPRRDIEFSIAVHQTKGAQAYRSLRDVSPVVDALAGSQFTDAVKRVRVFIDPARRDAVAVDDWIATIEAAA